MKRLFFLLFLISSVFAFSQVEPPSLINYQGVLRDSANNPLNGSYSMVFRFYDSPSGGTLLWEETYDASHPPLITVSNGLFKVELGGIMNWTGGSENVFTNVFTIFMEVYLGVQVGSDPEMTPRIRVNSSAYASNANTLDGRNSGEYAKLSVNETINADWNNTAFPWSDNEVSDVLTIGPGSTIDPSISIGNADTLDTFDSTYFLNTSSTPQTKTGQLTLNSSSGYGVYASGPTAGGYFKDANSSGYAYIAVGDVGIDVRGNAAGGYFGDLQGTSWVNIANGNYGIVSEGVDIGIQARGNTSGGYFYDWDNSGKAYIGYGDYGIDARGNTAGGYFSNTSGTAYANIAYSDGSLHYGIKANGTHAGGYFKNEGGSGYGFIGYGDYGIKVGGNDAGGWFKDKDNSGEAYVGYGDYGIEASGNSRGGRFFATTGGAGVGRGVSASGNEAGGYFEDNNGSAYTYIARDNDGIYACADGRGGYFAAITGAADIGIGVDALGNGAGGCFEDNNSTGYAYIGAGTYKIQGSGTVSFVQNHPYDKDKVIVYAAPEGDEVAVYTRGTGKLTNGEARVKLGETFKWVTNPDIGLTAYVTPIGDWADLYIEKKSTDELIVKSKAGNSNATFDYIVYGLRIGFEESSIVQEKQVESYIPSFKDHRERYNKFPELRNYNALERFKNMESNAKGIERSSIDLSRAFALKEEIHEYDPEKDPPSCQLLGHGPCPENIEQKSRSAEEQKSVNRESVKREGVNATEGLQPANERVIHESHLKEEPIKEISTSKDDLSCFTVYGQLEEGDVLVMNKDNGSSLILSKEPYDPMVIGVATKERGFCNDGTIFVKTSGVAYVKVDATFEKIRRGDLIVTSETSGYGMKGVNPPQGTVIGKALEDFEGGLGKIKVLLLAR